ncbi:MAG: hypothetical protein AAGU27_13115 [Dehalobacterium sp.]
MSEASTLLEIAVIATPEASTSDVSGSVVAVAPPSICGIPASTTVKVPGITSTFDESKYPTGVSEIPVDAAIELVLPSAITAAVARPTIIFLCFVKNILVCSFQLLL